MNKLPLISIGLCTYNGGPFLREQLESLVNQTYRPIEIRIRDDQSSDNTLEIIREFQAAYPFIHLVQNIQRLGFQKNFEAVFQDCTGELIAPCDQDDYWMPDKLQKLYPLLSNHQLVYHDSELINEKGESMRYWMSDKFQMGNWNQQEPFLLFNCISGHSMLFRKDLLHRALPIPESGYYDHWLVWVALESGPIRYCPEALVKYRQHQTNQTDLLGNRGKNSGWERTIQRIRRENIWLETCVEFVKKGNPEHPFIRFQTLAKKRETSFFNFRFGLEIWKHRTQILLLPHFSTMDSMVFSFRYSIGLKTKKLFYAIR